MNNKQVKLSHLQAIALLSLLTALCTVLRVVHLPIPNVQPVTDIFMVIALLLGFQWGFALATSTMVVSNLVLGFGLWTLPQIGAYIVCISFLLICVKLIPPIREHIIVQIILAGLIGYLYGFFVSIGMAIIGSMYGESFWAYYAAGILFDTYHAVGNVVFYPIVYPVLKKGLVKFYG